MDPSVALSSFLRELLTRFSDRCIEQLTGHSAGLLPLSITRDILGENIEKEVVKDREVIEQAVNAYKRGSFLTDAEIDLLWERSKVIDREFVHNIIMPSISIQLKFDDIREIRRKRFRFLADTVSDLLASLREGNAIDDAFLSLYTADQFHGFLNELLFLYCVEVKKLAASVRFLSPFNRAMDMFIDEVVEAMETVRQDLAAAETKRIFSSSPAARSRRTFVRTPSTNPRS